MYESICCGAQSPQACLSGIARLSAHVRAASHQDWYERYSEVLATSPLYAIRFVLIGVYSVCMLLLLQHSCLRMWEHLLSRFPLHFVEGIKLPEN